MLVLIQNQIEGRKWWLTYLNLSKSLEQGRQEVIKVIDQDKKDELEGFALLEGITKGIAVTSSRKANTHFMTLSWQ